MQIRTRRNRFLGHGHFAQQSNDGSYQTKRNKRLASPNCSETSSLIPRILQLLSKIYQSLFGKGTTTHKPDEEERSFLMDSRVSESVRYAERSFCISTHLVTARPCQTVSS